MQTSKYAASSGSTAANCCVQIGKMRRDSDDQKHFEMDFDTLGEVFRQDGVEYAKVAVLSIIGSYRCGKSFLMNLLNHYFQMDSVLTSDVLEEILELFQSKASKTPVTQGIWMSKKPIWIKCQGYAKVALFLMDTQGLFDGTQTPNNEAKMFAMTSVMSSYLTSNISKRLEAHHLEYFQKYLQYGKGLRPKEDVRHPQESVMFVIRDWQDDEEYGIDNGKMYLREKLNAENTTEQHQEVLKGIRESFQQLQCCLLPDPGKKAKAKKQQKIKLADIDEDFLEEVKKLAKHIVDNISLTQYDGAPVTGQRMVQICRIYSNHIKTDSTTTVLSLNEAHDELEMMRVIQKCREMFVDPRQNFEKGCVSDQAVTTLKERTFSETLSAFDKSMENHRRRDWVNQKKETFRKELENIWLCSVTSMKINLQARFDQAQHEALRVFQKVFEENCSTSEDTAKSIDIAQKAAVDSFNEAVSSFEFPDMKRDSFTIVEVVISQFEDFSLDKTPGKSSPYSAIKKEHAKILGQLKVKLLTSQGIDTYNEKFGELLHERSIRKEEDLQAVHNEMKKKLLEEVNKVADPRYAAEELRQFRDKLDERFEHWKNVNEANIRATYVAPKAESFWSNFWRAIKSPLGCRLM